MTLVPLLGGDAPLTMSSREIAELVDSRHDSVKRTVERLAERGTIGLPPTVEYLDSLGRPATEYRIGKRDSYVIVAQLSPEFTARLVDRWQELEAGQVPRTYLDALRALVVSEEQKQAQAHQIEAQRAKIAADAPKVEGFDYFLAGGQESLNLRRGMKVVGQKPDLAIKALRRGAVLYGTPATPRQYYIDKGYFEVRAVEDSNRQGKFRPQTFVTPKGLAWLREKLPTFMGEGIDA